MSRYKVLQEMSGHNQVEFNFITSYQSNHCNHPQADMADAEKQKEMDAKKAEV